MNIDSFALIPTPFPLIDIPQLQQNIQSYARHFAAAKINIRPHIKTHKCAEIAHRQIESGACGITTATLLEAEAMAAAGINNIFLAYPVVGNPALKAFSLLNDQIKISAAIDSIFHINEMSSFASLHHKAFKVRIEINCGHNRCGVSADETSLLPLVDALKKCGSSLQLEGVFTHAGHAYATTNPEEIEKIAHQEAFAVTRAAEIIKKAGLPCEVASVGSTPTARFSGIHGVTEARPGNYVFFDNIQVANGSATSHNCALAIISRAIGEYSDHLVIDAGSKALGLDRGAHGTTAVEGYGRIVGYENLVISRLSEEHGVITLPAGNPSRPRAGELIKIIPNHACAAANLFSSYQVWNGTALIDKWSLIGRR